MASEAVGTLYVIPGSHACRSAMLMLELKGIPYRTITLPTGLHPLLVRLSGFPGHQQPIRSFDGGTPRQLALVDRLGTVPALRLDGEAVQTNLAIARFLERVEQEPPLYPAEEPLRSQVQEAERWADETLQMAARRTVLAADLDKLYERGGAGRLGALLSRNGIVRSLASRTAARTFGADAEAERRLLAEVPALLDRVDGWIAAGVLDGEHLNAADLMIAPSLALLAYRHDLRPQIEARPAGRLLERVLPQAPHAAPRPASHAARA
ncbi:MAG TPA: glutathione S-transferase family protein [Solirubrobacteraceae bacterium]